MKVTQIKSQAPIVKITKPLTPKPQLSGPVGFGARFLALVKASPGPAGLDQGKMVIPTPSPEAHHGTCMHSRAYSVDETTRVHLPALSAGVLDDEYVRVDG